MYLAVLGREPELSKAAIKEALKEEEIPGAHMITNSNLQIK